MGAGRGRKEGRVGGDLHDGCHAWTYPAAYDLLQIRRQTCPRRQSSAQQISLQDHRREPLSQICNGPSTDDLICGRGRLLHHDDLLEPLRELRTEVRPALHEPVWELPTSPALDKLPCHLELLVLDPPPIFTDVGNSAMSSVGDQHWGKIYGPGFSAEESHHGVPTLQGDPELLVGAAAAILPHPPPHVYGALPVCAA